MEGCDSVEQDRFNRVTENNTGITVHQFTINNLYTVEPQWLEHLEWLETMEICSRYGQFMQLLVNHSTRLGDK